MLFETILRRLRRGHTLPSARSSTAGLSENKAKAKYRFRVTEQVADEIISLPMYPELTREQIEYTVQNVREAL